ncbi:hypothetical protein [Intestinibacter bartlettii]|uniref:hypothetical protein n=1 Tax=Intestinibacter bartlettii TaxID=261299 RepID=UPI0039916FB3
MQKKSNKKLLSKALVFLMVFALIGSDASIAAAARIIPPEGTYVISETEQKNCTWYNRKRSYNK